MESVRQSSLQIAPAARSNTQGRPLRQRALLKIDRKLAAERAFIEARYLRLCGLVALRNNDINSYEPLPDDFPMLVAPITGVQPYRAKGGQHEKSTPEEQAAKAVANGIEIVFDPTCLGDKPPQRDLAVREFCAAVVDFLVEPEGSRNSVPTPITATAPVAGAAAAAV